MRHAVAALALLLVGCVVHERVPDPPPAPPPQQPAPAPAPRVISEREAVQVAADFARRRGLSVSRYKAKLDPEGHWRVQMKSDQSKDRAWVVVDGRSGKVLRAKLRDADDWN